MSLSQLLQNEQLTSQQYKRLKQFISEQQKWVLTEEDPYHPCYETILEQYIIKAMDIYLWSIDPIISNTPNHIHQLARIWIEQKIYNMEPYKAAEYINTWLGVSL